MVNSNKKNQKSYVKKKKESLMDIIKKCVIDIEIKFIKKADKKSIPINNSKNGGVSRFTRNSGAINISDAISKASGIKDDKKAENKKFPSEDILIEYSLEQDKEKIIFNGGYGTIAKESGYMPKPRYLNYNYIFSHIGQFRSKSMYENSDAISNGEIFQNVSESSREMVSTDLIDRASRHYKYFFRGDILGDLGYVPPIGTDIDSKEWEKYRLMFMMSIYRPLFAMKRRSA